MKEYLKNRGFDIDDEIIKTWHLEPQTDYVNIPYFDTEGNLLYKRKNFPKGDPGHNGAKYLTPPADRLPENHSWLFNLHMAKDITDTMLLVEGGYNTIAAWIMSYYGLGIASQSTSLKDHDLKLIPKTVKKIIILFDETEFAIKRAKEILKYYNHIKVYIAKYPDKKDTNDYYIEGRRIDFKAIMNTADPYLEDKLTRTDIKVTIPENDFVETYKNYAMAMTDAPSKYQELMALSVIAAVLGRQVYLKNGVYNLYSNLFIVLLGKSTVMRKSACLNIAKHILRKFNNELILPNDFAPEGLFNLLPDKPAGVISWSEFGSFLINASTKSYQVE